MEEVCFSCQRCGEPLRMDNVFNVIDDGFLTDLASPLVSLKSSADQVIEEPVITTIDGVRRKITEPLQAEKTPRFSHVLEMTAQFFDVLTDQTEIDHPLCNDCTDRLLDLMELELSNTQDELKEYKVYLNERSEQDVDLEALEEELARLKKEDEEITARIQTVEKKKNVKMNERDFLLKQQESLKRVDREKFKEYMRLKDQWWKVTDEKMNVDNQYQCAKKQLEILSRTNVFNATFHIWYDGQFGTINGFRLGKLRDITVEWSEINIAWGQTVLLLHSLAKLMDFTFTNFRLVPFGDKAYIERTDKDQTETLPLHHTSSRMYRYDGKFDEGMIAFLDCLSQFKAMAERRNEHFRMPYSMANGKIKDSASATSYSIKLNMNSEEQWTKALKFMLTNLKWAVVAQTESNE